MTPRWEARQDRRCERTAVDNDTPYLAHEAG